MDPADKVIYRHTGAFSGSTYACVKPLEDLK